MKKLLSLVIVSIAICTGPVTANAQDAPSALKAFREVPVPTNCLGYVSSKTFEEVFKELKAPQGSGYRSGLVVIRSKAALNRFVETIQGQQRWRDRDRFENAIGQAKVNFSKEALVVLQHDEGSISTPTLFEKPILRNGTLSCRISRRKPVGIVLHAVVSYTFVLAVSKSMVDKVELLVSNKNSTRLSTAKKQHQPSQQTEREAIAALEKLGAKFKTDAMGKVTGISFTSGNITGQVFQHLQSLTNLRELDLSYRRIRDRDLQHLKRIKKLETLYLPGFHLTSAGLVHLKGMTNLRELDLSANKITDLVCLKGLTKLQTLNLSDTQVTDTNLVDLKGMKNLTDLVLSGTRITDVGLVHLKELSKLRFLEIFDTRVTRVGVAKLEKALPKLLLSF